ncbi:MAG: PilZ domain-containing protein [Candidatus Eremiobacteraeota bacterium]|nr:PilZ domain-containing protein [Candidatus Eremiobacteraeota bacterium]
MAAARINGYMVWLARQPPEPSQPARGNQRQSYRQSIELPIAVSVRGLPAPVYGTLINISETGCRLRSLILLDRSRLIEFELARPGSQPLLLRGRVLSRTTPQSEAGYEYGVAFEELTPGDQDALGREIAEMQRRAAAARVSAREAAKYAGDAGKQRRTAVRTFVAFPIRYRHNNKSATSAEANDISAGGLRLLTQEALPIGGEVEFRFTLPNDVLAVYPKADDRLEITPFGRRRIRVPDNRRPFTEMTIRGRILSRQEPQRGFEVYGVSFTEIDGYQREEIARFTHACQLARIRKTG